jgi:diketogulonate reductase-like aldo/keto reductase
VWTRIRENFELDSELDADQMARIDALDQGESGWRGPDPGHVRDAPEVDA